MVNTNWMVLQGSYNEVDHCYFKGKNNQGPYLVVRYFKPPGYVDGSDQSPSTFHRIHHNYFGYRTLPSNNGGEDMRIGDSFTSFTHGFNVIEYNYFEDHRLEAEVISNKSCNNIYRFNTFVNNDGQLVLRHGENCFVYGNFFDGNSGRNLSGGIRIINANQTVFNNYISNVQGSSKDAFKAGIVIMSGLKDSPLNGYYAADNAIVAYNRLVDCETPVFKIGFGNKNKALPLVAPKNITLVNNIVVNAIGENNLAIEYSPVSYDIKTRGFFELNLTLNTSIVDLINQRLSVHQIVLTEKEITRFDPSWKLSKEDVGVSWSKF
jgi:poly(beta-D-mannuronate) lyase